MTALAVPEDAGPLPRSGLLWLAGLLLATAVIADPSDKLVLPPDTTDSLSDRVYGDTIWRPEPTPDTGWRAETPEKPGRIQWGTDYDSIYDPARPDEAPNIFSSGPAASGPRPATIFRWSF